MSLKPITSTDDAVCPNVHVYFIMKPNCGACNKFKTNGEYDAIIKYLDGKTTQSTHNADTIKQDSMVPDEVKQNISWVPLIMCKIATEDGNQYGVMNGQILANGTIKRQDKYPWNKCESIRQWLCDTIPKRYCNDNNICIGTNQVYTKNPFYA